MVPITRRASSPNIMLYFLINNKAMLIRSMLAAGVVQNAFVGEAVEDEGRSPGHVYWRSCTRRRRRRRDYWRLFLQLFLLVLLPLSLPFPSS